MSASLSNIYGAQQKDLSSSPVRRFWRTFVSRWQRTSCISWAFLVVTFVLLVLIMVVGGTAMSANRLDTVNALILIFTAIFMMLFAADAVYGENKIQLVTFAAVLMVMVFRAFYVIALQFRSGSRDPSYYVLVSTLAVTVVASLVLAFFAGRSFGWLLFKEVGTDPNVVRAYQQYQAYLGLMKLDLQLAVGGAVALVAFFNYKPWEYAASISLIVTTVLFSILSVFVVRAANMLFCIGFMLFSCIMPGYVLYKMIRMMTNCDGLNWYNIDPNDKQTACVGLEIGGIGALICRLLMVVSLGVLVVNFRNGHLQAAFAPKDPGQVPGSSDPFLFTPLVSDQAQSV